MRATLAGAFHKCIFYRSQCDLIGRFGLLFKLFDIYLLRKLAEIFDIFLGDLKLDQNVSQI